MLKPRCILCRKPVPDNHTRCVKHWLNNQNQWMKTTNLSTSTAHPEGDHYEPHGKNLHTGTAHRRTGGAPACWRA